MRTWRFTLHLASKALAERNSAGGEQRLGGGESAGLRGEGEVETPFPGRLCEVIAQTEPASAIDSSTVYVRSEASSPSD
eukprot:4636467-Amphidinium_carterae.1